MGRNIYYPSYEQGSEGFYSNFIDENSGDQRNYSVQVNAYLTAHWMMVSHLIWTVELSLTTWGNTLFRR